MKRRLTLGADGGARRRVRRTAGLGRRQGLCGLQAWRQAQSFYKQHGGPKKDPHRLDGDDDGIACEALR